MESSTHSKLGSKHWYITLMAGIRDMGLFMGKEPDRAAGTRETSTWLLDAGLPSGMPLWQHYGWQIAAKAEELLANPRYANGEGTHTFVASYKDSYQISPDEWAVQNRAMKCDESTTLGEILAWYSPNNKDIKTMQVMINLLEGGEK